MELSSSAPQGDEGVIIKNRDTLDVIRCYDSPEAFHFVDHPT